MPFPILSLTTFLFHATGNRTARWLQEFAKFSVTLPPTSSLFLLCLLTCPFTALPGKTRLHQKWPVRVLTAPPPYSILPSIAFALDIHLFHNIRAQITSHLILFSPQQAMLTFTKGCASGCVCPVRAGALAQWLRARDPGARMRRRGSWLCS